MSRRIQFDCTIQARFEQCIYVLFVCVADVIIDDQGYAVPPRISRQEESTTLCDVVFTKYTVFYTSVVRNHCNECAPQL